MRYTCTADECAVARCVAERRNLFNRGQTNLPQGETHTSDQRFEQHYKACLSEIGVSRILNLSWSGCGKGSDGRRDVGDYIEVRTNTGNYRGLLIRPRDPEAPFVLATVNAETGTIEILGWEWSSEVRTSGRLKSGDTDKPFRVLDVPKLQRPEGLLAVADEARGTLYDHEPGQSTQSALDGGKRSATAG